MFHRLLLSCWKEPKSLNGTFTHISRCIFIWQLCIRKKKKMESKINATFSIFNIKQQKSDYSSQEQTGAFPSSCTINHETNGLACFVFFPLNPDKQMRTGWVKINIHSLPWGSARAAHARCAPLHPHPPTNGVRGSWTDKEQCSCRI